ncbi:chromosome segregation protein SMC [Alphaproteobacteria bacterium KMM 3653]|uniref:Chromosome partition protein Smc n=1 Tax=Harenicola maris TaxID=2841044 RepID=A0AAP2CTM5_9RHOB|nr:chromosome segregation protein SMC [Harenicola maris]
MQFHRLRLNGFKSFVDPTDLMIAEGLTGVVGPNGCGKSNLLEALRWVMGENRPTAMRGGGMEDVIFAGAATRPARNFAEVALFIDNSERLAPAGFNDTDNLEVIRRITRDAGSAYKANTKDVRARDIQMLFADASTGSHSPALVRQGQISELINAKPKNRRRILEEAAGISGLYQRRHEAELKLKGAETNLARVDDVIEALATQLGQLARQARQAARYREIGTDLRLSEGLLLYRRWREAADAVETLSAEVRERTSAAGAAERAALEADKARDAADEALPALREEDAIAGALVQRLEVEQRGLAEDEARAEALIKTLAARVEQLDRDIAREAELNGDAEATIARLAEESARLAKNDAGQEDRLNEAMAAAREAAVTLQSIEAGLSQETEDVARLSARHQSAQRMEAEAQAALNRHQTEADKARATVAHASEAGGKAAAAAEEAEASLTAAQAAALAAEAALTEADTARTEAATREAAARAALSAAEGEAGALKAELGALSRLVAKEAGAGDQLLDQLTVAPGFEKALGAALADDLQAPVVEGAEASGWTALAAYGEVRGLPGGARALSEVVTGPEVLARRLTHTGVVSLAEAVAAQGDLSPGQRLVTAEGDLFRWDGFIALAADAGSTAALRLQQMNRMQELRQDLEEAEARAAGAGKAHALLTSELDDLTRADKEAREARRRADQAAAEASRAQSRAESDAAMAASRLEAAELAVSRHAAEAEAAETRVREARDALAELPDLDAARSGVEAAQARVEEARQEMIAKRALQDEIRRMGEARQRRAREIEREQKTWRDRLSTAEQRQAELSERRAASEAEFESASAAPDALEARRAKMQAGIDEASTRRRASTEALRAGETELREAEITARAAAAAASEAREKRAAAEARVEAVKEAAQAAAHRIEEELEIAPQALLEKLGADPEKIPDAEKIEADISKLRRQRDALGAVNLRAEEDAKEVSEEHDLLVSEKADLEEAIRTLRNGIASLNREGRERLLTAFEEVNGSFGTLFKHLFGGGEARLELVESDDPLEAGLEIMCQPPGKKLSTLSLLSGGEQTLTALALIFAVFLANPAPICVLDEVDAPLDDANVTRFCDMLDEMTRRTNTRFLVITHHAVTMSRMDRLFGVTMQEQGVSQLVSVDLKKAEALVA